MHINKIKQNRIYHSEIILESGLNGRTQMFPNNHIFRKGPNKVQFLFGVSEMLILIMQPKTDLLLIFLFWRNITINANTVEITDPLTPDFWTTIARVSRCDVTHK